jgi:hypothetical protein
MPPPAERKKSKKILFFGEVFCYVSNIHTLDRALRGNDHSSGRPAPPDLPDFFFMVAFS